MKKFFFILLPVLLSACAKPDAYSEDYAVEVAEVYHLVSDTAQMPTPEVETFLRVVGYPSADEWSKSRAAAVFTPDVDSVFPSGANLGIIIGNILERAKDEGLQIPQRSYAAVVYGRPESIMFADSVMLIALNHYLGADYPGYSHLPYYMRSGKTPERMPYDIAEALTATSYPYVGVDKPTLLSRMLYQGALTEAKMRLVPGAKLTDALGYSEEELDYLQKNEKALWESLVASRLLYDTSAATADRMLAPAPSVGITTPAAPGRAGRYIGYTLVRRYLDKNPQASMPELLAMQELQ